MSVTEAYVLAPREPSRRIWTKVLGGQVLGTLALWAVAIVLGLAGVTIRPVGAGLYAPWRPLDGWATLADLG